MNRSPWFDLSGLAYLSKPVCLIIAGQQIERLLWTAEHRSIPETATFGAGGLFETGSATYVNADARAGFSTRLGALMIGRHLTGVSLWGVVVGCRLTGASFDDQLRLAASTDCRVASFGGRHHKNRCLFNEGQSWRQTDSGRLPQNSENAELVCQAWRCETNLRRGNLGQKFPVARTKWSSYNLDQLGRLAQLARAPR